MNGRKTKQIRRAAARSSMSYEALKQQYLHMRRHPGAQSTSKTPAAPGDMTSVQTRQRFMGHRTSKNRTAPVSISPVYALHPNRDWHDEFRKVGMSSPKYQRNLAAQGRRA